MWRGGPGCANLSRMTSTATPARRLAGRLVSLDVFRGLTMAAMVIVNDPGDWDHAYWPLLHAEWNGWTPTDLIFPFFLFMVGVSMTLSKSTMGSGWKSVRRGLTIVALGALLAGFPRFPLATWRIPGVLVRIGLCYLAAVGIFRLTAPGPERDDWRHGWRLLAWIVALTVGYWLVMVFVPVSGSQPGRPDARPGTSARSSTGRSSARTTCGSGARGTRRGC